MITGIETETLEVIANRVLAAITTSTRDDLTECLWPDFSPAVETACRIGFEPWPGYLADIEPYFTLDNIEWEEI